MITVNGIDYFPKFFCTKIFLENQKKMENKRKKKKTLIKKSSVKKKSKEEVIHENKQVAESAQLYAQIINLQ